jgi:outer membrane protein TolC
LFKAAKIISFHRKTAANSLLLIFLLSNIVILSGCAFEKPADAKKKVDSDVYKMIDAKWKDDFGNKSNYRIDKPLPNDVSTSQKLNSGMVLTLPDAVAIATDHNRAYQTRKEELYIEALDLRLARHQFEPILFGAASAEYLKARGGTATEEKASLGLQKMFETGGTIGINVTLAWIDILTGNATGGLAKILTVAGSQPLLRGSDPNIVLENLTQSERDLLYQVRSFNRYRKEFVVSTISQYYQVLQTLDRFENARRNYDVLSGVCGKAEKLAKAGRLPQFELDQAIQDRLIARDNVIQAEKSYKKTLDDFKLVLAANAQTNFEIDCNELAAMKSVKMTMPVFSQSEAIETAIAHRLDLANTFDAVNDAERKVMVAIDSLKPDLRIIAAADLKSQNTSDAITLRKARNTANVGLQFDPAFDKAAQENVYSFALIVVDRNRRQYEEKIDRVSLDIRKDYRNLSEAAQRYIVQSEQLTLAKKRFDNTMLLLQYGKASTRDVLDAQRDLYRAQDAATDSLINYTVSMLNFYLDVEILQVRPDGMWQI